MDKIEEIKSKIDIVTLVSEYVDLKKTGRNYKGLSPFKSENTPSFVVSPDKEIAYCFATNQGGDIFEFYQLVENVSFKEAVQALAEKTGVVLDNFNYSKEESSKDRKLKEDLYEIHKIAASFFMNNLWNPEDKVAKSLLEYLDKRGITSETIRKYKIGYAGAKSDELSLFLLKQGFSRESLVASGVSYAKGTDLGRLQDRFRERLIIPIADGNGRVVAFGGRIIRDDQNPKYLNSPETDIYKKNKILFGFDLAKQSIRQEEKVIVVEGYFDQIACYQAGIQNVVAVSGTALTNGHLRLLKRFAHEVVLCFDSDNAGQQAMLRSSEIAYEEGLNVKVLSISGGYKDPAESLQSGETFRDDVENSYDFHDYVLKNYFLNIPEESRYSPSNVNKFLELIFPVLHKVESFITKDVVLRQLASKLRVKVDVLYAELKRYDDSQKSRKKVVPKKNNAVNPKRVLILEEQLWSYFFLEPKIFEKFAEQIYEKSFIWDEKEVYNLFLHYYNEAALDKVTINLLKGIAQLYEKYSINILQIESMLTGDVDISYLVGQLFDRIQKEYKKKKLEEIILKLKSLPSKEINTDTHRKLLEQFNKINTM